MAVSKKRQEALAASLVEASVRSKLPSSNKGVWECGEFVLSTRQACHWLLVIVGGSPRSLPVEHSRCCLVTGCQTSVEIWRFGEVPDWVDW